MVMMNNGNGNNDGDSDGDSANEVGNVSNFIIIPQILDTNITFLYIYIFFSFRKSLK